MYVLNVIGKTGSSQTLITDFKNLVLPLDAKAEVIGYLGKIIAAKEPGEKYFKVQ